ncbi:MAG: hypothetical protein K8S15_03980 [Candidatus Aegiribacteria sp.]|nr:hypothetical protein [Candidatus Aegiribacteria sp.]
MIKPMRSNRRKVFILASAIVSAILISVACTSTDTTGPEIKPQGAVGCHRQCLDGDRESQIRLHNH